MKNNKVEKFCTNCNHKKQIALFSISCGNAEAIEARGTSFPDAQNCPLWKPEKKTEKKIKYEFAMNKINDEF